MDKQATELPSDDRIRELKNMGFVASLSTAGVPEDRIAELYTAYQEQDAARTQNLEVAYKTIVGG